MPVNDPEEASKKNDAITNDSPISRVPTNDEVTDSEAQMLSSQLIEPLLASALGELPSTTTTTTTTTSSQPPPSLRGLLFYRSIYFLGGLSSAAWGRFGIIYYNRIQHLNASQIGLLQGVAPILSFISQPLWGYLADRIHSRKTIFLLCKGCSTALLLSLSWRTVINSFGRIFLCVAGMSCFTSGGVLDAHTLDFLGEAHRGMYGSIRLWTAVSWGLGAVIMGFITDKLGFHWNFCLFGAMMIMMLLTVALGLPARSKSEQELYERSINSSSHEYDRNSDNHGNEATTNSAPARPRLSALWMAIGRLPVCLWLLEVAVIGAGMVIVDSFLFVFLQDELKASTELCGYTVGVTVLLELPIFHFSEELLAKLGHDNLFLVSMLAYASRVIGYTFLTPDTVHWVLLLEFSHGITFACMWISSIDYAASVAPKEWSTTVQSLLSTALTCVGGGLGPILGGLVMDHYGPIVMFRGIGALVGGLLVVHLIALVIFQQGHDKFLETLGAERLHDENDLSEPLLDDADMDSQPRQG